jgi:oligoendopeptidase F
LDSLKVAEIDLTAPSVVEEAISLFENTLNQFEEILQKQKKSQI